MTTGSIASHSTSPLIILSSLGVGAYRAANYQSEHHEQPVRTGLFAVALHTWYPEAQVKLLATERASRGDNGQFVREHYPQFSEVRIPEGRTEEEAWELFETITAAVPAGARVIYDITHGLRSLPMLGFLALSYLRVVKGVTLERVFYGAVELIRDDLAPVVDLTPLVTLLDWAQAASRFQDTGDARLFHPLVRERFNSPLNGVADKLNVISTALANNRTLEVADETRQLSLKIRQAAQQETLLKHRPFLAVMDQLEQALLPLQVQSDQVLNLQAHYAQVLWYYQRGHHVQAIGLAREWLVSVMTWYETGALQVDREARSAAEELLNRNARAPQDAPPALQEAARVWDLIVNIRNDLLHFGMRPVTGRTLGRNVEKNVTKAITALPAAVRPLGIELEEVSQ